MVKDNEVARLWKIEIVVKQDQQNRIQETFYFDNLDKAHKMLNKEWGEEGFAWAELKEIV